MKADRVQVFRDEQSNTWIIQIQIGEEVIRRHCHEPKDASEELLLNAAVKTVEDEGYTIDPLNIVVS